MKRMLCFAVAALAAGLTLAAPAGAAAPYDPHTVIVKYRDGASDAAKAQAAGSTGLGAVVGSILHTSARVVL